MGGNDFKIIKQRLTKKNRNNIARKKLKKNKISDTNTKTITAVETGIFKNKAVLTYLMVGISFFSFITTIEKNHPFFYIYEDEISPKVAQASEDSKETVLERELKEKISPIVKGTPMEKMTKVVSKRSKPVAALLVGIAMKESKFGTYSPKKNGSDCFNYWGYRGKENPTASGYSCFKTPEQAVKIVGDRIEKMVNNGAKTPSDMISWKCGSTCAGHPAENVRKWISDVGIYYYQINSTKEIAKE